MGPGRVGRGGAHGCDDQHDQDRGEERVRGGTSSGHGSRLQRGFGPAEPNLRMLAFLSGGPMRRSHLLALAAVSVSAAALLARLAGAAQPLASFHEGFYPRGVTQGNLFQEAWFGSAADLDGDGRDELITGRWEMETDIAWVQIRSFGPGAWDASTATDLRAGLYSPGEVEVADLNGDGVLDLLAPAFDTLAVFPGTSPGSFGPRVAIPMPGIVYVAAADLDGDDVVDLAIARGQAKIVQIWKGLGGFASASGDQYSTHHGPGSISAVDLNTDGIPDLVVAANTISTVLIGDGNGHFSPHEVTANRAETCGDLNGDGREDLLT